MQELLIWKGRGDGKECRVVADKKREWGEIDVWSRLRKKYEITLNEEEEEDWEEGRGITELKKRK